MNPAIPDAKQVEWAELEIGVLIHFDLDVFDPVFKNQGLQSLPYAPDIVHFNPKSIYTDQWLRVAQSANAKYAILTAKHGTGFVLFPDPEYDYAVDNAPWKDGNGDIVGDFIASCNKFGIKPGLYYNVNFNEYLDFKKDKINEYPAEKIASYFKLVERHLKMIWTRYGPLFEIWFDGGTFSQPGAPDILGMIKEFQPDAICFQGPAGGGIRRIRWVGNESARAPNPCWSTSDYSGNFDGVTEDRVVGVGDPDGSEWMPAESDVPNRFQKWKWNPNDDYLVTPAPYMVEHYLNTVGRNTNLLLGMVINDDGLVPEGDAQEFNNFGKLLKIYFGSPKMRYDGGSGTQHSIESVLPETINYIMIMEDIAQGERIREYCVEYQAFSSAIWHEIASGKSIGHKRIHAFDPITTNKLRLIIKDSIGGPIIKSIETYYFDLDIEA